jgi:glycerol-3-phosphate acyltransferase PlsY
VYVLPWLTVAVACYLVGSLPSAYLTGRLAYRVDVRRLGDGNAGAANVWHSLGRRPGALVAALDILKGVSAVVVARQLMDGQGAIMLGGVMAVAGHNWPLYLGLRGGRGAATAGGVLVVLWPVAVLPLALVAAAALVLARSTTVAFAFLFAPLPAVAWYTGASLALIAYSAALPTLVGLTHLVTMHRGAHPGKAVLPQPDVGGEVPRGG